MISGKKISTRRIVLIISGLSALFLPVQRFRMGNTYHTVFLLENYSSWSVAGFILGIAAYNIWKIVRKKQTFWIADVLSGMLLGGWVIFTFYHTLTLFPDQDPLQLSGILNAAAFPGEALFLLFLCSVLLMMQGFQNRKQQDVHPV